jgi:AraC-like DNA-binding protein
MSEKIVQHEQHVYCDDEPFHFYEMAEDGSAVARNISPGTAGFHPGVLFEHWHGDLEFCYYWDRDCRSRARHHINGELVCSSPGRLIATNSSFIHNIIVEPYDSRKIVATIVLIKPEFLREALPEYENFYFTNTKEKASPALGQCVQRIHDYIENLQHTDCAHLYGTSLVMEFLYLAVQEGIVARDVTASVNRDKDLERMKGIISYIENHYREPMAQAQVAQKFYFCGAYFSKYFKQCTGMTFTEYVSRYRVERARRELLMTEKSITDIALDNGFADARRLILHFKSYYGMTPLQYRKLKK